jgi:S-formylglutathione hydrolase
MSQKLELKSSNKCFGGELRKYSFQSKVLGDLSTNFNIFLPPNATNAPVLYYLAGLTCTEDNGAQKGAFHEAAAKEGIAVVYPDTSPRGAKIEGEDESYDFGSGAGFYINATKAPYSKNYKMYDHIVKEIPELLKAEKLPVVSRIASRLHTKLND